LRGAPSAYSRAPIFVRVPGPQNLYFNHCRCVKQSAICYLRTHLFHMHYVGRPVSLLALLPLQIGNGHKLYAYRFCELKEDGFSSWNMPV